MKKHRSQNSAQNSNTTATAKSPAAEQTKSKSKTMFPIKFAILFFAIILVAIYYLWTTQQRIQMNWQELEQEIRSNAKFNYQKSYDYMNERLGVIEARFNDINDNINTSVSNQVNNAVNKRLPGLESQLSKFYLFQAINFLQEANLNLYYWGNKPKVALALQAAFDSLEKINLPSVDPILQQISKLINSFDNKELQHKQELLNQIKLIGKIVQTTTFSKIIPATTKQNITDNNTSVWQQKLNNLYKELKTYLVINRKNSKENLLDSIAILTIKEKILVLLENLKLAVITGNNDFYKLNLNNLQDILSVENVKINALPEIIAVTLKLKKVDLVNTEQQKIQHLTTNLTALLAKTMR